MPSDYLRVYRLLSPLAHKTRPYTLLLVALSIIVALTIFHSQVQSSLRTWKLLPQPPSFTELYFTTTNYLPIHYVPGQTQSFSFTVHNVEHRVEHYYYTIVQGTHPDQPRQFLSSGGFSLDQGAYRHELAHVVLQPLGNRVNVTVTVTVSSSRKQQSITYWVTRVLP